MFLGVISDDSGFPVRFHDSFYQIYILKINNICQYMISNKVCQHNHTLQSLYSHHTVHLHNHQYIQYNQVFFSLMRIFHINRHLMVRGFRKFGRHLLSTQFFLEHILDVHTQILQEYIKYLGPNQQWVYNHNDAKLIYYSW